jgi:hypothetical protein
MKLKKDQKAYRHQTYNLNRDCMNSHPGFNSQGCDKYHTMTDTYNAGNFQEYAYETEWLECSWKATYGMLNLVTAFWYPWLQK